MELDDLLGRLRTIGKLSTQRDMTTAISLAQSLTERFQRESAEGREAITAMLRREVRDLLLALAGDLAVLSVRRRDPEMVKLALMVLALEGGRQDYRDSLICMAMLFHSGNKLGIDIAQAFADAAHWATEPSFSAMLGRFPQRRQEDRDLSAFGRREATEPEGFRYQEVEYPQRRFSLHNMSRLFGRR